MQQTITPEKQTVELCLKNKSYYIDFYQREYVWSKSTVEVLLRDIFYAFELSYEQYKDSELSQEILEKFNWYYLNIFITNNINGKVYVVDGQQRLSTLTLVATKLYHITDNEDLKDTLKECIFGKDKWKGNIFRMDHDKRKDVMECILSDKAYANPYKNKTEETLVERYKDISKYIDDKAMDPKKLTAFISYFLERLVLVELTITKDDTPMIFEVINDRGEALKPFEILKGKLVGALSKDDTEAYSNKWDTAIARLFGIEDDFFSDYIKSRFVFKRNSKIESEINNSYHRYIFESNSSNEIAKGLKFRRSDNNYIKNIKTFIDNNLNYYSSLYAKIRSNCDEFLRYNNVIHSLSGQYQIIMAACSINDPEEDLKITALAKEFDRMYMLLRLNGVYDSNSFQEISYSLNEKISGVAIEDYRSVFNKVTIDAIEKRKGIAGLISLLDYNTFIKKDYTNMDTRSLRYFLARIEQYICKETNQTMKNDVEYISTKTGAQTGYHIEHILSRNDQNKAYFTSEEEFESKRNLLGGLLLLKGVDNISSGNEEYNDKLKTYSAGLIWGHSLCSDFYHTNKSMDAFNDKLFEACGHKIESIDIFDATALEHRSQLLYNLVKIVWEIE